MNMKHITFGSLLYLSLALSAGSCKKEEIAAEPAGTGGANSGGTNTGGVAEAGGGGGALVKDQCQQGLAGPALVRLPAPDGSFYCMDERETTVAEYTAFMNEATAQPKTQPAECDWNDSFVPQTYEEGESPTGCAQASWSNLKANPGFAMGCVDFCDAFAYCKWAGKRLCSAVGGDGSKLLTTDLATGTSIATSVAGEWFGACSQGGQSKYAYGDTRDPSKCVETEKFKALGNASLDVTNSPSTCHGTVEPYSSIRDMHGSVAEWQNVCRNQNCVVSGSSVADQDPLGCEEFGLFARPNENPFVGIRCCADAVVPE